jgi:hypothetical protein
VTPETDKSSKLPFLLFETTSVQVVDTFIIIINDVGADAPDAVVFVFNSHVGVFIILIFVIYVVGADLDIDT